MFARLFSSSATNASPQSLIETQIEFKQALLHITKLRTKSADLKKAAGEDFGSLDYRKFIIVSDLLEQLDEKIKNYNEPKQIQGEHKGESKEIDQTEKTIQFAHELHILIKTFYMTYVETLNQQRGALSQNEAAKHIIKMGAVAVGLTAAGACATTMGAIVTYAYASSTVDKGCKGILGIEKTPAKTATSIIICNLIDALENVSKNAGLVYNLKSKGKQRNSEHPDEFICPITLDLMEDPYECSTNNKSYEKKDIVKWITEHGTDPYRTPATIDNLKENVELRNKIKEYKASKPELADPESAAGLRLV